MLNKFLYTAILRKPSTYVATIFASAFALELSFDSGFASFWDSINKGRQWKDIRGKYIQ